MRHLTLLFCTVVLLSSCRKDSHEFTSDFPNAFSTMVEIHYYEYTNTTNVAVGFYMPADYGSRYLKLPADAYLKVNGVELTMQEGYSYYEHNFEGKPTCEIEFIDSDGIVYMNTIIPPDTAYFINLADTISSFDNFQIEVNPLLPDSNERNAICVDGHGDDYGCNYYGIDSLITLDYAPSLGTNMNHNLYLYRSKYLTDPYLPYGGGGIGYHYVVHKTFFTP